MSEPAGTVHPQDLVTRFAFGDNWARFLKLLDDKRIAQAENSLRANLESVDLRGRTFLDVGSGSGLFSLAARRLGARVMSFDLDKQSVACTQELKRRFFEHDGQWTVLQGSALDQAFLQQLGSFDIVYSWGVLHHTGAMWTALENIAPLVAPDGQLFIALYNDQGTASRLWWAIKKAYVSWPSALRVLLLVPCYIRLWGPTLLKDLAHLRPLATWRQRKLERGMSPHRDVIDWVGGFPFEVCKPEEVFDFFRKRGFSLQRLKTCGGGHGCNEFVLRRLP